VDYVFAVIMTYSCRPVTSCLLLHHRTGLLAGV